jgi:hypothetical protein
MRFAVAIVLLALLAPIARGGAPAVEILDPARTISQRPEFYQAWPTMKRLGSGRLMLVYSGGREDHLCPFGWIETMTSDDDGHTWTWPRVLFDSTIDDRDAGLLETAKGTLLMPIWISDIYHLDLDNPDRRFKDMPREQRDAMFARWRLADSRTTPAEKKIELGDYAGRWMLRSRDGGLTWEQRVQIPAYNLSGPIQLRDGRILFAGTDPKHPAVWESKDEGVTWTELATLPTRAGEMDMIEAADGRLIVHVRDHERDGKREKGIFQTVSRDGGKTWSDVTLVTATGWPPNPLKLSDGTLITTYGVRKEPFGIRGKLSKDNGDTWSDEFTLYDKGYNWDMGYPTTVELKDGSLLTVWYETPQGVHNAVLRQTRWKVN